MTYFGPKMDYKGERSSIQTKISLKPQTIRATKVVACFLHQYLFGYNTVSKVFRGIIHRHGYLMYGRGVSLGETKLIPRSTGPTDRKQSTS